MPDDDLTGVPTFELEARLAAGQGKDSWTLSDQPDPVEAHRRVTDFFQTNSLAGVPWTQARASFEQRFPDLDPSDQEEVYARHGQAARLAHARRVADVVYDDQRLDSSRFLRGAVSAIRGPITAYVYGRAKKRLDEGKPEPRDYEDIAIYEREQDHEARAGSTWKGALQGIAARAPGMVGEYVAGTKVAGAALKGLGVAQGAGWGAAAVRNAAATAAMPSQYLEGAMRANAEKGRDPLDLQGLPAPFALAFIQNAVVGSLGAIGEAVVPGKGVAAEVGRGAARAVVGAGEQSAFDIAAGKVQDQVRRIAPDWVPAESHYGPIGDLLDGRKGDSLRNATVMALTFGAFGLTHAGGHGPERPTGIDSSSSVDVRDAYQKALASMAKRGMGRDAAGQALMRPADVFKSLFAENPDATRADALAAMNGLPDGPIREWGEALARTLPERVAEPEGQRAADDNRPAGPSDGAGPRGVALEGDDGGADRPGDAADRPVPAEADNQGNDVPQEAPPSPGTLARDPGAVNPAAEPARPEPTVADARIAQDAPAPESGPRAAEGAKVEPGATPERVEELRAALEAVGWKSRGKPLDRLSPEEVLAEAKRLGIDRAVEAAGVESSKPDQPTEASIGNVPNAPRPDADEFAAAGLSKREADVIARRRQGESLEKIGKSFLITRERVRQIEKAAQEKLGVQESVAKAGEAEAVNNALARIERLRENPVARAEVSGQFDPETGKRLPKAAKRKLSKLDEQTDAISALADQWLKEAEGGELDAGRAAHFEAEAARILGRGEGGPGVPPGEPAEVGGGVRGEARPDPGRRGGDADPVADMLRDAAAQAKSYGLSLAGLRLNAGRGKKDSSSYKRLDEIADSMARKYPELFRSHPDAGDRLYDLIVAGKPKPGASFEEQARQAALRRPFEPAVRRGDADEGLEAELGSPDRTDEVEPGVSFAPQGQKAIPGSPDPTFKAVEGDHPVYARINDGLMRNPRLTPEQRSSLGRATTSVLKRMPDDARSALAGGMSDTHFHGDLQAVAQDIVAATMANPRIPMETKGVLTDMARGWRDGTAPLPGGAYVGRLVIIDEGYSTERGAKGEFGGRDWTAERLHAHEYAHAVGRASAVDTSPAWVAAHAKEFGTPEKPRFNDYAATDPKEGFAEVMSYLWGTDGPTDVIAKKFPETKAILKEAGLWIDRKTPVGRDGERSFLQRVRDIFSRKVPLGDDGHADLMLQKGDDVRLQRPAGDDDERVTSTRKLTVDAEREELGLPAIPAAAKRGAEHLWAYAQDQAARDPQAAGRLIDSLEREPRAATDAERYQLLHERVTQGIRIERLARGLDAEVADPADRVLREREYDDALVARDRLDKVLRSAGTEAGRGLAAIKAAAKEDYSLARMLADARAAKGEPLTAEETARIKELQAKIEELQGKLDAQGEEGLGGKEDFEDEATKKKFRQIVDSFKWQKATPAQKVFRVAGEIPNVSRALLLGLDLPPLLRQGGLFTLSHPVKSVRAWAETFKAFSSEEGAFRLMRQLERRENYGFATKSGLEITATDGKLSGREEQFASKLVGKIPVLGPALERLERWHSAYLNRARMDLFDAMAATMTAKEGKITRDEATVFANAANVFTGRGNLGSFQKHADGLAKIFLAPKWVASRMQVLAGQPLYTADKAARNVVAREYARAAVGFGVLYGLANLLGSDTEKDARSADFGKLRTGRTRIDPTAGLANPLTFGARVLSGSTKTISGEVRPIRGERKSKDNPGGIPYGADDAADVAARFLRSKLAPVPGALVDLASGRNVVGDPTPPKEVAKNLAVPIVVKDAEQIMTEEYGLPKKVAVNLLGLLGAGVRVNDRKDATPAPKPTR